VLTIQRLWFGLTQIIRFLSITFFFMVIPFTMDPHTYGVTFKGMGLPDRLAFTVDLAFRFIPTLVRDFSVTLDAQRARGYEIERAKGGLISQLRRIAPACSSYVNAILTTKMSLMPWTYVVLACINAWIRFLNAGGLTSC
jgi:energy-coupling factor transporter transmembrane protein EcfT